MPSPTSLRRALVVIVGAIALLLGSAAGASAHAELLRADPPPGSAAPAGTSTLTLTFEAFLPDLPYRATVTDSAGTDKATNVTARGHTTMVISTDPLSAGSYTVTYRVVSTDGHPTDGSYTFTVAAGPASTPPMATPLAPGGGSPSPSGSPTVTASPGPTTGTAPPSPATSTPTPAAASSSSPVASAAGGQGGSGSAALVVGVIALLLVLALGAVLLVRRRAGR